MSESSRPFLGKFRGIVTQNTDPSQKGRVRARVPDVFGEQESGWALPASPYAGDGVGFFMIPPVDASVWIEFEHGDPDYPIWSGCFWEEGQVPNSQGVPEIKIIKTDVATITLNDQSGSGGVTIETTDGMKVVMTSSGVEVSAASGTLKLNGTQVNINNGALEVA